MPRWQVHSLSRHFCSPHVNPRGPIASGTWDDSQRGIQHLHDVSPALGAPNRPHDRCRCHWLSPNTIKSVQIHGNREHGGTTIWKKLESSITYDGLDLWVQEKMMVGRIYSYKPSFFRPNIRYGTSTPSSLDGLFWGELGPSFWSLACFDGFLIPQ